MRPTGRRSGRGWPKSAGEPGALEVCRGGRGQQWGPHPAPRGRIPPRIIHGGESWWRRGGAPHRPLAAEPDRDGPRRRDTGGAGGARYRGSGARVSGGCGPARGGDRAGLWAVAGEGGRGRAGRARGRTPRGPRGLGEGSRGRPFLEGGGGCSLPGLRRGAAWCGAGAQQCGAAQGCSVGPRRGAAWGRGGARRAAAYGRGMGPRWGAARGCAGAQRGAAQGRGAGPRMGAAWGRAGAQQRGAERGRSVGLRTGAARGRAGA